MKKSNKKKRTSQEEKIYKMLIDFFNKAGERIRTITGNFYYKPSRPNIEYELRFYYEALSHYLSSNTERDAKAFYGETKLGIGEHLDKYILIHGTLVNVKTNSDNYITSICLEDPVVFEGPFTTNGSGKPDMHLSFAEGWNVSVPKKYYLDHKNRVKEKAIGTHVWVPVTTFPVDTEGLYLGSNIQVLGKVGEYKGKVNTEGYRTYKYGLKNGIIFGQAQRVARKDLRHLEFEDRSTKSGTKISKVTNYENMVRLRPISNFHKEYAVGLLDTNAKKFIFQKEAYDFFRNVKTPNDRDSKFIGLLYDCDMYIKMQAQRIKITRDEFLTPFLEGSEKYKKEKQIKKELKEYEEKRRENDS